MLTSSESGAPSAFIPLCEPAIRGNEGRYVQECLSTGWLSTGSFLDRFEKELATRVGARYAVATASGTSALHVALLVTGIEPDDEVLLPALTFIAPANAIRYVGAWPVFLDVDPVYLQLDPSKVADFLHTQCQRIEGHWRNRRTGRRVKAIVPVHILGHPVDMDPLLELARRFDLIVIEDATESLGAKYKGRPVGQLGDIACFSFNGNKLITTGGGGMIVTSNSHWSERARYLINQAKDDPLEYVHRTIGYNYRLSNLQAAVGCAQFEQLDSYIAAKRAIAERYDEVLGRAAGLSPMREAPWASSVAWMYTVQVNEAAYGISSRALLAKLGKARIQARPLWQPLHRSPAHAASSPGECQVADELYRDGLSLPCSVGLTSADQERVIDNITSR